MKIQAKTVDIAKATADMLAVFVFPGKNDGEVVFSEEAKRLDKKFSGLLTRMVDTEKFTAATSKTLFTYSPLAEQNQKVLLVGVGVLDKLSARDLLHLAAAVVNRAKDVRASELVVAIPSELIDRFGSQNFAELYAIGTRLGAYSFHKHKGPAEQAKVHEIGSVSLLTSPSKVSVVQSGIDKGEIFSLAVTFTRDLVNDPPSTTTPTYLGDVAKTLASKTNNISVDVMGKTEMAKLGMNGILGIARGSSQEPKFIKLHYQGSSSKTVVIVGKGITFDTGGLSLKPAEGMETMKLDMSGAAAVLGVFSVLSELKPKVTVVGLIPATENMPGPSAIKPGDVVTAMNGKSIEILNTDAEGRVVLADALSYATAKYKPAAIIDLATLTGACMVALGEDVAGLFCNNDVLSDDLLKVAAASGEELWRLPLVSAYRELIKSSVADIKNITGKRYGGAITGALFLQEFVPDTIPWAHLDIAGPAFTEKGSPLSPKGGTGYGVLTLLNYLESQK